MILLVLGTLINIYKIKHTNDLRGSKQEKRSRLTKTIIEADKIYIIWLCLEST